MGPFPISLTFDFAWREISAKYRNSFLGLVWLVLSPLATLTIYTLVFSGILGLRLTNDNSGMMDYALALAAGLIVSFFFSDVLAEAPTVISGHAHYVKKVVFPLPVLVLAKILSHLLTLAVGLTILIFFLWFKNGSLPPTLWLLPLMLVPCVVFSSGFAFGLAALGVFLPDTKEILKPILQLLFYLAPVVYPLSMVPASYHRLVWANPLTSMVQPVRQVLLLGEQPDWKMYSLFSACSALVLVVGFLFFEKTRPGFADVL